MVPRASTTDTIAGTAKSGENQRASVSDMEAFTGAFTTREISMSKTLCIAIIIAGISTGTANAATPGSDRRTAATNARETRQDQRLAAGIASGSINSTEAARIANQQVRIDHSQARLAADGRLSARDYARLDARQDKASRTIARARKNRF